MKVANHNTRIRLLLFFARPLHVFNIILFFNLWRYMSYGPSTFKSYYSGSASQVVQSLWHSEFSIYIWYFVIAAVLDVVVQEYLPLIKD